MNLPFSPPTQHVLVVEDDDGLREEISRCLGQYGYAVHAAPDGPGMDDLLATHPVDLVVLDVMLPGEDGLSICRRLAVQGEPAVIIVSARAEEVDRIVGLELGADDYLAKPCSPRELLARIRAVLRRRASAGVQGPPPSVGYSFLGFRFDMTRRQLRAPDGVIIALTGGEAAVLAVLVHHAGQVVSRATLVEEAHGDDSEVYDRAIDVQISRLRGKLRTACRRELIRTIRGAGYLFDAPVVGS